MMEVVRVENEQRRGREGGWGEQAWVGDRVLRFSDGLGEELCDPTSIAMRPAIEMGHPG